MQFKRDYYRMLIKNNPQEAENYIKEFNGGNMPTSTPKTQESKVSPQEPTKKEDKKENKTKEEHKEYMKYLRAEYKKKFGKGVAPKYINDEKYIIGKLEE